MAMKRGSNPDEYMLSYGTKHEVIVNKELTRNYAIHRDSQLITDYAADLEAMTGSSGEQGDPLR